MAKTIANKKNVIRDVQGHDQDTGSSEVQVTLITERIKILNKHFEGNAKDYSSRRGLNILLARRRAQLAYLRRTKPQSYDALIARLGLRK
jgi:small subunit ribosomal protein S15